VIALPNNGPKHSFNGPTRQIDAPSKSPTPQKNCGLFKAILSAASVIGPASSGHSCDSDDNRIGAITFRKWMATIFFAPYFRQIQFAVNL
jgi:hypothetical protein